MNNTKNTARMFVTSWLWGRKSFLFNNFNFVV